MASPNFWVPAKILDEVFLGFRNMIRKLLLYKEQGKNNNYVR